jgi:hypothetical protein
MPTSASFCIVICVDVTIVTTGSRPLFLITAKIDSVRNIVEFIDKNNWQDRHIASHSLIGLTICMLD